MEISPIPGIRALPMVKPRPLDAELSAVFDIEHSAGASDDTYSGTGKRTAGGQDDNDDSEGDAAEMENPEQQRAVKSDSSIDLFA
jgi:hypothetical protein